jgi:hypothetical protein
MSCDRFLRTDSLDEMRFVHVELMLRPAEEIRDRLLHSPVGRVRLRPEQEPGQLDGHEQKTEAQVRQYDGITY